MSDHLKAKIDALQLERDTLEARVIMLEDALYGGFAEFPTEWSLTAQEERYLGVLLARPGIATRQMFLAAVYAGRDEAEAKIIDVVICKLRRKLEPFGIEIETVWGRGYRLVDVEKAKALAFGENRTRAEVALANFTGRLSHSVLVKRMEAAIGGV